jgi:ribonucleoside-diphosphate reductase alpha chain
MNHRPLGLGVQGLADVFCILRIPFESSAAQKLNRQIFETIYYAAVEESCDLAKKYGPYKTFKNSPASQGKFKFDLYKEYMTNLYYNKQFKVKNELDDLFRNVHDKTLNYDWDSLRKSVVKYGLRNSLLIAIMPTASTSQILGNNECIEPFQSNIFTRRTGINDYIVVNKYCAAALKKIGLWNLDIVNHIIKNRGSIQHIKGPNKVSKELAEIKEIFKTSWEIPQSCVIKMGIQRQLYVCQGQSINVHMDHDDKVNVKLLKCMFYGWRHGQINLSYYIRLRESISHKILNESYDISKSSNEYTLDKKVSNTYKKSCKMYTQDCESCSG